jgi:hypothetical protein
MTMLPPRRPEDAIGTSKLSSLQRTSKPSSVETENQADEDRTHAYRLEKRTASVLSSPTKFVTAVIKKTKLVDSSSDDIDGQQNCTEKDSMEKNKSKPSKTHFALSAKDFTRPLLPRPKSGEQAGYLAIANPNVNTNQINGTDRKRLASDSDKTPTAARDNEPVRKKEPSPGAQSMISDASATTEPAEKRYTGRTTRCLRSFSSDKSDPESAGPGSRASSRARGAASIPPGISSTVEIAEPSKPGLGKSWRKGLKGNLAKGQTASVAIGYNRVHNTTLSKQ